MKNAESYRSVVFSLLLSLSAVFAGACRPAPEAELRLPQQLPAPDAGVATAVVEPENIAGPGEAGRPAWLPSDPDAPLPLWPAIRRTRLDNGLTSYVMRHPHPPARAQVWLAVHAGSVLEDEDQRGLAHFVEHMAFNGTANFEGQAIVKWAESIGMRFGADVNAYTGFDATVYQLEVPTDDPQHLEKALDVLRDWAGRVSFDAAAVDLERGVVLEEWRLSRGVGERISDIHFPVVFKGSRYATRLPIGLPEIIRGAPREALVRFYQRFYRPDLMAVMVVGDIDANQVEGAIARRFGDLVNPPVTGDVRPVAGVPEAGLRVSIATDAELPRASVTVQDTLPHRSEATARDYRRGMAESLWQLIMAERMAALEQRPDAPFEDGGFSIDSPTHEIDTLTGVALARPGGVEDALRGLMTERLKAAQGRFSSEEIARARANLKRFYEDYDLTLDTVTADTFADEMTRNFFEGELMVGAAAEKALALAAIDSLTSDEIAMAGRAFAEGGRRVVLISAPADEKVPDEARVRAIIDDVAATLPAEGPAEEGAAGVLVDTPPEPGAVVSETAVPGVDAVVWTLSNGARVFVKQTDFAIDQVVISAYSPGGYAAIDDADFGQARFALSALGQGGAGGLDVMALGRTLAGKSAAADVSLGDFFEGVSAGGSVRDLETILQLLWLRMTAPRLDEKAVKLWVERSKLQLEAEKRVPEAQFARELAAILTSNHPRRLPATAEELDAVDLQKALAIHRDRFGDVSDFDFAIVGAVDPVVLKPLVARWLGALPGAGRKESEKDLGVAMPAGVVEKTWRLGSEPRAAVQLHLHREAAWERDADRDLRILADVLRTRLREVLREDLGGVYGVQVGGVFERQPKSRWFLSIEFGCAPERVDELVAAIYAEMERIKEAGAAPELLGRLREIALRTRESQLRDNGFWASWLLTAARFGDDPAMILDPAPYLARIDNTHVMAAAARYLDRSQMVKAVLLPAP